MTLAELISALEAEDPRKVLPHGFARPHSYRGYYEELAFEPASNVTVAAMLHDARSARGATFEGYKGGDYEMCDYTDCWLAFEGSAAGETIGPLLLKLMVDNGTVPDVSTPMPEPRETAPEVPAELIDLAFKHYSMHGNGLVHNILAAVLPANEAMVRAKVAEQMRRAAEGRRHYAASWPPGDPSREYLETEAHAFDSAAKVAEGDMRIMLALLPLVMWTAEEERYARGEQP